MVMIMWLGLLIPFFGTTLMAQPLCTLSKIKRMNFYLDAFQVLPLVSWWLQVFGLY